MRRPPIEGRAQDDHAGVAEVVEGPGGHTREGCPRRKGLRPGGGEWIVQGHTSDSLRPVLPGHMLPATMPRIPHRTQTVRTRITFAGFPARRGTARLTGGQA